MIRGLCIDSLWAYIPPCVFLSLSTGTSWRAGRSSRLGTSRMLCRASRPAGCRATSSTRSFEPVLVPIPSLFDLVQIVRCNYVIHPVSLDSPTPWPYSSTHSAVSLCLCLCLCLSPCVSLCLSVCLPVSLCLSLCAWVRVHRSASRRPPWNPNKNDGVYCRLTFTN